MANPKQTNGKVSQNYPGTFHSQPVTLKKVSLPSKPNDSKNNSPILPTNQEKVDESTANFFKVYEQNTGLPNDYPTILLNTEFLPIYQNEELNSVGQSLNLKEQSGILTAKNAVTLLSKLPEAEKFVDANAKKINEFSDLGEELVNSLFVDLSNTDKLMHTRRTVNYPPSYNVFTDLGNKSSVSQQGSNRGTSTNTAASSIYSTDADFPKNITDYLISKNYKKEDVDNFSETKLWLQALVELKYSLTVASVGTSNYNMNSRENFVEIDKEANSIAVAPNSISGKTKWLNNRIVFPLDVATILNKSFGADENSYATQIADPISKVLNFSTNKTENCIFVNNPYDNVPLTQDQVPPSVSVGVDHSNFVATLANILQREKEYSTVLNKYSTTLANDYGYTVVNLVNNTFTNGNSAAWDYLIGRFTPDAQDFPELPTGNGRSLVSLCNAYYPATNTNRNYKILTFERDFPVTNEKNITPGYKYYIDSSLSSKDGRTFDVTRLDQLQQKLNSALNSINIIEDFVNLDPEAPESLFSVKEIENRLSYLKKIYLNCYVKSPNGVDTLFQKSGLLNTSDFDTKIRFFAMLVKRIMQLHPSSVQCAHALADLYVMCVTFAESQDLLAVSSTNYSFAASHFVSSMKLELSKDDDSVGPKPFTNAKIVFFQYEKTAIPTKSIEDFFVNRDPFWMEFMKIFKDEYDRTKNLSATIYSGIDRNFYMLMFMFNMLNIVASLTPEDIFEVATPQNTGGGDVEDIQYVESLGLDAPNAGVSMPDSFICTSRKKNYSLEESESDIDIETTALDWYTLNGDTLTSNVMKSVIDLMRDEYNELLSEVRLFKYFILNTKSAVDKLSDTLKKNFEPYLQKVFPIISSNQRLSQTQRSALLNMSLSEEQLLLSKYILSEMSDRLTETDGTSKLSSFPSFFDFPDKFGKFLPINDTELLSFTSLSTYFKSVEFGRVKGGNKRIISVGIPHKMMKKLLVYEPSSEADVILGNIVKVKVWKINLLNRALTYLPKNFLFEMRRFPTRAAGNWSYESFAKDVNILQVPTKYFFDNAFEVHSDYTTAFGRHGSSLNDQQKLEIYTNHTKSYLVEEYVRWFTDCNIDETRLYHYDPLNPELVQVAKSYKSYVDMVAAASGKKKTGTVAATFKDPVSNQEYKIFTDVDEQSYVSQGVKQSKTQNKNTKIFDLDMTETMKTYFSRETLMLPFEDLVSRVVYPKKFDRTFSIIFDPDDFIVDVTDIRNGTDTALKEAVDKMVDDGYLVANAGVVQGYVQKNLYRQREVTQEDAYMDEYFVTVEPYLGSTNYAG
jgi:hypothetical protein